MALTNPDQKNAEAQENAELLANSTTVKLSITCNITNEKITTFNYNYAKASVTSAQAQTLANALVTNGSIFKKVPLSVKSIKLIQTDTTDLSS